MRNRSILSGSAAALGIFILILDSKTALDGAAAGLELCLKTVVPSLFPFLFLSNLLTHALNGSALPILRPVRRLFSMPENTEALLIPAFLGGYPIGAQCVATAYENGQLSTGEANRLLTFCSNPGPAFLFGMAGRFFPKWWMIWLLWGILLFSAFLVSRLFPCGVRRSGGTVSTPIGVSPMKTAAAVMGSICGWVIVFRVLITFLDRWFLWLLPGYLRLTLIGSLELTNGCCSLGQIEDISLRFVLAAGFLSFGGMCVTMQTMSVIRGLSLKQYLKGKLLQTLFSLILSIGVFRPLLLIPAAGILFLILPGKNRKRSRNPASVGV